MADMPMNWLKLQSELKGLGLSGTPSKGTVRLVLDEKLKMPDEAYSLTVSQESVLLEASSESGLFYAKEAPETTGTGFGKGTVELVRSQISPLWLEVLCWMKAVISSVKEKVKQYLDIMASLRMNIFHWHLTDEPGWRIEIKKYPKLTSVGAIGNWHDPEAPAKFYTQEEIKEIVAYAAERHIMVVPEFDMPGHATAVSRSYPEPSGGGEGKWDGFTFHPLQGRRPISLSAMFSMKSSLYSLSIYPYRWG